MHPKKYHSPSKKTKSPGCHCNPSQIWFASAVADLLPLPRPPRGGGRCFVPRRCRPRCASRPVRPGSGSLLDGIKVAWISCVHIYLYIYICICSMDSWRIIHMRIIFITCFTLLKYMPCTQVGFQQPAHRLDLLLLPGPFSFFGLAGSLAKAANQWSNHQPPTRI